MRFAVSCFPVECWKQPSHKRDALAKIALPHPIPAHIRKVVVIQTMKFYAPILFSFVIGIAALTGCNPSTSPEPEDKTPPENVTDKQTSADSTPTSDTGSNDTDISGAGQVDGEFTYSILHWNVESGGNDPETVAGQLVEIGSYDLIGLSEVHVPEAYEKALTEKWPERYQYIRGVSGTNEDREDDHLWMAFDTNVFSLVDSQEMNEIGDFVFDDGHHRVPLYVRLKDKSNGQEVVFMMNHLARGNKEFRQAQARTLREWARTKSVPIVAIGDYNLDFVFATEKGNKAFDEFMKDNVWKWVRPEPLVDTNWSDRDGDGIDNYIDSLLDFSFVAGAAKEWNASSRVIVRDGDFPDDDKTSDHRPVELILKNK